MLTPANAFGSKTQKICSHSPGRAFPRLQFNNGFRFVLISSSVLITLLMVPACAIRIDPGQSENAGSGSSVPASTSPESSSTNPSTISSQPPTQMSSSENKPGQSASENKGVFRTGAISFDLINKTGRPIERFFASPANISDWEDDILGDYVLPPGQQVTITIEDNRNDCFYDFMATLGPSLDGRVGHGEMIHSKINICSLASYEFAEQ